MNILEAIRRERHLTFGQLGGLIGCKRHVAWEHCHAPRIPAEAAIRYANALGVPLALLRPDLFLPSPYTPPTAAPE